MSMQRLGAAVVVMERFDAAELLRLIERYRVTPTQLVPTMFVRLLRLPDEERRRHDLSSLRFAVHAAAPCPVEVELLAHCRRELASYKCPRSVDFVDELPRDPSGKLYKRLLRERYWEGHVSRSHGPSGRASRVV